MGRLFFTMSTFPKPKYFIQNGVRRALIARELGQTTIRANIYRQAGGAILGQQVELNQLYSPKTEVDRDTRYNSLKLRIAAEGQLREIELEPLGEQGQPHAVELAQVLLV
jgi:hypothetical protein